MLTSEPFPGFTIMRDTDGTFCVYQRTALGEHERVGSADTYDDAHEIASSLHLLLADAWQWAS